MLSGDGPWEVPKEPQPELERPEVHWGSAGSKWDWLQQGLERSGCKQGWGAGFMELPRSLSVRMTLL